MKQNSDLSEDTLWQELRDNIGHKGHFSRVESPDTSPGIPDVDFCVFGAEGHIELKFINEKVKKRWIRGTQVRWFNKRIKNGGHPWLFALILLNGKRHYCLFSGEDVAALAKTTDTQLIIEQAYRCWHDTGDWANFISCIQSTY